MASPTTVPPRILALPNLRAPLLVGVTGHRLIDQSQLPQLRSRIESLFRDLQGQLPDTPIILLSALAEGADQLAAEVAMNLNWPLIAPLPMEPQRYSRTFSDSEAGARMLEMVSAGTHVQILGGTADSDEVCYQKVETYLAQHSHLLVALWDGLPAEGNGGTADVVRSARTSEIHLRCARVDLPRQMEIQRTPSVPVFWLPTQRAGKPVMGNVQKGLIVLPPCSASEESTSLQDSKGLKLRDVVRSYWREIDLLNRAIHRQPTEGATVGAWDQRFDAADEKAIRLQKWTRRLFTMRLGMVVVGFLALELAAGPLVGMGWVSLLGLVLLVVGTVSLGGLNKRLDRCYLDIRTLAEHLRICRFIPVEAGQQEGSVNLLRHLRLMEEPRDWLCHTLNSWLLIDRFSGTCPPEPQAQPVLKHWVMDQAAYFQKASAREKKADILWSRWAIGWLVLGLAVSGLLAGSFLPALRNYPQEIQISLAVIATTSILFAAACRTIPAYRAFGPLANRYSLAFARFRSTEERVKFALQDGDDDEAWRCLAALADLALRENSEWFALHLERPPDPEI